MEYDYNIEKVMKSLLLVDKPNLSDDSIKDAKSISDAQMEQFVNLNKTANTRKGYNIKNR